MKLFMCLMLAASLALVHASLSDEKLEDQWRVFKKTYKKSYGGPVEEKFRKMIFIENSHKIYKHHQKYLNGQSKFDMDMNHFGDLLHHEFVSTISCLSSDKMDLQGNGSTFLSPENVEVPKSINWVAKGYVTPIKNQGTCGSCWSFGATGALEGQHKKKTGDLVSLSEQNLVDCSSKYGNKGCSGGLPNNAFKYIKVNKGIDTEESYPYEMKEAECRFKRKDVGATDTGYSVIKSGSESSLMKAVGNVGPIAVGIDACEESFQFYSEGIYDDPDCTAAKLCHAVLVVGYGKLKGEDFWLVKNSWGTAWGKKGYGRMSRNKENQCGIATLASFPLV